MDEQSKATETLLNLDQDLSPQELFLQNLDVQRQQVEKRSKELQIIIQEENKIAQKLQDDNEKYTEALNMLKSLNDKINAIDNIESEESKHTEIEVAACFESIQEMKRDIANRDREEEEETFTLEEKEMHYKNDAALNETLNEKEKLAASVFKKLLQQLDDKKIRDRRYNIIKIRNKTGNSKDINKP